MLCVPAYLLQSQQAFCRPSEGLGRYIIGQLSYLPGEGEANMTAERTAYWGHVPHAAAAILPI